jgi:putative phosphoribosyl transferase
MAGQTQSSFSDRRDAARQLATKLKSSALRDPLVLGIPRGGVVLAAVLAHELNADLDVVLARKLCAPGLPEYAIGAISENGEADLNAAAIRLTGASAEYVESEKRSQLKVIEERKNMYRQVRPPVSITGRSVIVTDDGIATGATMIAALKSIGTQRPYELIAAIPVAPEGRLEEIQRLCRTVICLLVPPDFRSVGQFYNDFSAVDDQDVLRILRENAQPLANRN